MLELRMPWHAVAFCCWLSQQQLPSTESAASFQLKLMLELTLSAATSPLHSRAIAEHRTQPLLKEPYFRVALQ